MPSTDMPTPTNRYAELTWPQVAEWVARDPVLVIPVATLEDHGYHLPIDTDVVIAETLADRAVTARPGRALLLPTVTHGYTPHHMDFPGPITIGWKTFVDHLVDIGRSVLHHGFRRILFVNGHGSNVPLVDMATRLIMLEEREQIDPREHLAFDNPGLGSQPPGGALFITRTCRWLHKLVNQARLGIYQHHRLLCHHQAGDRIFHVEAKRKSPLPARTSEFGTVEI